MGCHGYRLPAHAGGEGGEEHRLPETRTHDLAAWTTPGDPVPAETMYW